MKTLLTTRVTYGGILLIILAGCSLKKDDQEQTITTALQPASVSHQLAAAKITNTNNFALQQEPIYLPFYDLGISAQSDAVKRLNIIAGGSAQPSQTIDADGDGTLDGLLLVTDFNPAEIKHLVISSDPAIAKPALKKQTQAEISIKQGGKWEGKNYVGGIFKNVQSVTPPPQYTDQSQWIRYEGPGIESDKVAYRVYLDWRNGIDIFGKKTREVVLQHVGLNSYDSYHVNAQWGMDILKVGKSLGMGGFGFWNGKSVDLVSLVDSREAIITNNGDLYSSFKINYNGWQINNQKVDLNAHFSMNAGSRLVNMKLKASQELPNLAIGLVKHPGTTFLKGNQNISDLTWTYVASWGKQSLSGEQDHLGMAIIFRHADHLEQVMDEHSYVSVMKTGANALEYYFLAAWEHELEGIKTEQDFKAYLDREIERLSKRPIVHLNQP